MSIGGHTTRGVYRSWIDFGNNLRVYYHDREKFLAALDKIDDVKKEVTGMRK